MTTTASVTKDFEKLTKAHESSRVKVAEIKAERNAAEVEARTRRSEEETPSAETRAAFPNNFDFVWSDQEKLDQAVAEAHEAEQAAIRFRYQHHDELVSEIAEPAVNALAEIEQAFQTIAEQSDVYLGTVAGVTDFIVNTPALDGRDSSHDPRVKEWGELAKAALASAAHARIA